MKNGLEQMRESHLMILKVLEAQIKAYLATFSKFSIVSFDWSILVKAMQSQQLGLKTQHMHSD